MARREDDNVTKTSLCCQVCLPRFWVNPWGWDRPGPCGRTSSSCEPHPGRPEGSCRPRAEDVRAHGDALLASAARLAVAWGRISCPAARGRSEAQQQHVVDELARGRPRTSALSSVRARSLGRGKPSGETRLCLNARPRCCWLPPGRFALQLPSRKGPRRAGPA